MQSSVNQQARIPENETGLPLVEAIDKATGRRPHLCTALRWCQKRNRHGVKLQSWFIGGRRVTSVEAVRRYNQQTTEAANATQSLPRATAAQKAKAHTAAVDDLEREFNN